MAINDYCTIALRGDNESNHDETTDVDVLSSWFPGAAYATRVSGGVAVYPEPDTRTPDRGDFLAHYVSRRTQSAVLLSEVRGDILRLRLFVSGVTVDEYVAETPDGDAPTGGNAPALLAAFGAPADAAGFLAPLLRATRFDDDYGYGAASDRHTEIADLLGVPEIAGIGYEAITRGQLPEGVAQSSLRRFAGISLSLWQFALLRVPEGTSEAEVASYVLPDIISLERGIEVDDWTSDFGTLSAVRETLAASESAQESAGWIVLPAATGALYFDFGCRRDTDTVETIRVFLSTPPGTKEAGVAQLVAAAQAIGGTIWDWETRRVV